MLAIVTTLAKVSLANRELTFPNTREAGIDAGTGIAAGLQGRSACTVVRRR
jgi:hypothetical protein